ncbi:hypothetical protein [Serratia proteamaculans]|uniref:hypothetical protein n=1 Tax=Serratia proteamaculans TaxID=28151 RepID=UPI0039AEB299
MNIDQLLKALKPKLHEVEFHGQKLYIKRPTMSNVEQCLATAKQTLIHCVTDENGDPVFSDDEITGRVDVNVIDAVIANELFQLVVNLMTEKSNEVEELEKK